MSPHSPFCALILTRALVKSSALDIVYGAICLAAPAMVNLHDFSQKLWILLYFPDGITCDHYMLNPWKQDVFLYIFKSPYITNIYCL